MPIVKVLLENNHSPALKHLPSVIVFYICILTLPLEVAPLTSSVHVVVAIIVFTAITIVSFFIPKRYFRSSGISMIPFCSIIAIGVLRFGTGGPLSPYSIMIMLPLIWLATSVGNKNIVLIFLSTTVVFLLPFLIENDFSVNSQIFRVLFAPTIYTIAGVAIGNITSNLRKKEAESQDSLEALKHKDRLLEESQQFMLSIWEAITEQALMVTDMSGKIIFWNSGAERILAYSSEYINKNNVHITDLYDLESLEKQIKKISPDVVALKNLKSFAELTEIVSKSIPENFIWHYISAYKKKVPMQVSCTQYYDNKSRNLGFVFLATDMTKQLELDKMQENFLGLVSHELRTPLTSILGYLDLLNDTEEQDTLSLEQKKYITVISNNSKRLKLLVNDVLLAAQIKEKQFSLSKQKIDLRDTVQYSANTAKIMIAKKNITLIVNIPNEPVVVLADEQRIGQVLDNLLSNATKFTPREGKITITANLDKNNKKIRVSIIDTGIGIPKNEIKNLSEKFFRTSNTINSAIPGIGLGLNITKSILEAHNSNLNISSTEGSGATFSFELPIQI